MVKNKIAPPFKQAEFDIIYGQGISKEADILDLGVSLGVVDKSGAWYSFNDERIGQGRQNVRRFLSENIDIRDKISDIIMEKTGLKKTVQKALMKRAMARKISQGKKLVSGLTFCRNDTGQNFKRLNTTR